MGRSGCQGISQGESIEAQGEIIEHPVYGSQFKVVSYELVLPEDAAGMERYLSSGAIKGIGASLAARIVKKFGTDTFRIMEEEPERLAEIKGISERMAWSISEQVEDKKDMREAFIYLQKFGISNTMAVKIYNTYHGSVYTIMQENPYKLAEDVEGIGFRIADDIANKIGIHMDSDYRIRCGVLYILSQALGEGHTYLPKPLLLSRAEELLGVTFTSIEPHLDNLMMDKKLIIKKNKETGEQQIFASSCYYAELNCARMLANLNISIVGEGEMLPSQEEGIKKRIEAITVAEELELDELQEHAVLESIKNGLLILSGGPGTGKTTTIRYLSGGSYWQSSETYDRSNWI